MPRFVILEHRWEGVHWDFMLENEGVLRTWAIDSPVRSGIVQPARPLADHRLAYLEYEGAISGDRGSVVRIDCGNFQTLADSPRGTVLRLEGVRFVGCVELRRVEIHKEGEVGTGDWSFRFDEGNLDCKTLRDGSFGA